jgi:aminopeptidase N
MDLYFERHDGQAVTCDDFRSAMADANGRDLSQFGRWYEQAGTPVIEGTDEFDPDAGRYVLTLRQSYPQTGYEVIDTAVHRPLHVPVSIGLLDRNGSELPLRLEGETRPSTGTTRVLELTEPEQRFVFVGLERRPVASLLRGFSAPVRLRMQRSADDFAFLMAHDSDPFNRWDAGQELATRLLLANAARHGQEGSVPPSLDPLYSAAFGRVLADDKLDGSLRALALTLPNEKVLAQEMEIVEPDALFAAREQMRRALAIEHSDALLGLYLAASDGRAYANTKADIDLRRLKNCALGYLVAGGGDESIALAAAQFRAADNMSDAQAALAVLVDTSSAEAGEALASFYERWRGDPLVLDKWFSIQATSRREDAVERVIELAEHPDFSLRNPNRVRSLVAMFCSGNQVRFNRRDGAGYRFLSDVVKRLDPRNPQLAARMASLFNPWRRFDSQRQALMRSELEGIRALTGLSKDVYEIVTRALAD